MPAHPTRRIACVRWTELPIVAHLRRLPALPDPTWSLPTASPRSASRGGRGRGGPIQLSLTGVADPSAKDHLARLPATSPIPRALVRGEGGGARIVAVCTRARLEGVHIGMTVAEARARLPALALATFEPARVEAADLAITTALVEVSPRLGRTSEASGCFGLRPSTSKHDDYLLDLDSPKDLELLSEVVRDLDFGPATIGVADGAFAAVCAAHVIEPSRGDAPRRKIVSRGGDASFLAPLPSSLLPAPASTVDAFSALGLDTMALVAALPLEGVQARLGEEGRFLVGLARGEAPPALATHVPAQEPTTEVDFADEADGATSLDAVLFALRASILRLVPPLAARGHGIGELELSFEVKHGRPTRIVLRPSRPEVDPQALFELARATVEGAFRTPESREDFAAVTKLRLTATSLVPIEHTGEKLAFARRDATVLPLDVALARLRGRFGGDRVVTPTRNEDPRPDGRGVFRPVKPELVAERASTKPPAPTLRERLRTPSSSVGAVILSRAPIVGDPWPVRAVGNHDPRRARRVVREVGPPERVASGWWSEPFDLVYRWIVADDGGRALFARGSTGSEEGGWRLVGVAD
jgi:protein ImuB